MTQSRFAAALMDPEAPIPAGLVGPDGQAAPRRFAVYRNNVALSLTRALEAAFPTVRKLVGEAFFAALAGDFLRAHPPRSRMLMLYGAEMPEFLAQFQPVAHLGYLPDVARLDQAMRESYHAADSRALPEAEFQRLVGADIAGLRLHLAPSLRLVRSAWPVVSIWEANHEGGASPRAVAEDALVLRPAFDPRPWRLPTGGGAFVAGLMQGLALGDCVDLAGPDLDLVAVLGVMIAGKAITGVVE
ncbi:HvfC/BufC N-terminal domain-containing protein [Tabrizicola thermarum]|uniref:HvfC/BufC N-terminal domain-containing protein n=1 Tax=Tabrizicola thermarum TaxID=2670345 RepID=UPI000FFBEEC3|nr:DNA-binding domain-containing protein [Tabrizicola thermarum]